MDLYDLLGVRHDADVSDIKRAYRRLARRLHPDLNPGDRAAALRFQAVVEAYETLSDPDRRRQYDLSGVAGSSAVEAVTFGFEGFDFSGPVVQGAGASTFGDLFADVIHETLGGTGAPSPGADLHVAVSIGLADVMHGAQRTLSVLRRGACRTCLGAGAIAISETTCPNCRGTGAIRSVRGRMVFAKPCARCTGSGRLRRAPCQACASTGVDSCADSVTIAIPPGVRDGERLGLPGMGHAGTRGGSPGSLFVTVHVEPHPVFSRDGDDLLVTVPVAVHEAALGTRIDVPTLDGPVRLRVPPGTQAGQRFRLRDRGFPTPREGRRGDLVVDIRIVLPAVLDERAKALLREFGELQSDDVRAALWRSVRGE